MTNERIYEENKTLRDEVCRQRVALDAYKQSMDNITEKYVEKGADNCRLIAENAILKSVIKDVPKADRKLKQINLQESIENICIRQPRNRYSRLIPGD